MRNQEFKKVKYKDYLTIGRCVNCKARDICYLEIFKCDCDFTEHYIINIKFIRKLKLEKLNEKM